MSVRVLLADDQRLVRESLGTMLGLLDGIELVGSAADGEQAVALATELQPDVVLMDLRMPDVDGIEATRLLRERLPDTGVIALTTYADDESVLGRAARRRSRLPDKGRVQRGHPCSDPVRGLGLGHARPGRPTPCGGCVGQRASAARADAAARFPTT